MKDDEGRLPGKGILKVAGVLLIVFGGVVILAMVSALLTLEDWLGDFGGEELRGAWLAHYAMGLASAAWGVFTGIMGVKHNGNAAMAGLCRVFGAVVIVLLVVSNGAGFVTGAAVHFVHLGIAPLLMIPIGLIIPIVYIIGAQKNMSGSKYV